MPSQVRKPDAVVLSGAADSNVFATEGAEIIGYALPATVTSVAMRYKTCATVDGTYNLLYDVTGTLISTTVSANKNFDVPGEVMAWPFFKFSFGGNEGGDRTIQVVARLGGS